MSQNSLLEKFNLNIIKWYPFENDKTLLQIGNNENLEKYLKNILKDVKSTKIIQDAEQFNMLFDYILIYGYEGQDNIMENAKKYLNKNGKVLIIGNNDLGINTWSKYDITRTSGILKLENNFKIKTIKNVLKELETNNYKIQNTFYIFPDYSKAEIIINKNFKVDGTKIDKYNPNIFENDIKVFNEKDVLKTIINNDSNMLETFANSYFIEATKSTDSYENIEEEKRNKEDSNSIKYVSFNNSRKEQYQLITIIKNDIVEKLPANINSKSHIENMSNIIEQINNDNINILDYFKDGKIYSKLIKDKLTLDEILFFETADSVVAVHTATQIYETHLRLYELEKMLPGSFLRVSKSCIMNTGMIRSVRKNITGASEVEFTDSVKKAYVSRSYFKVLTDKLEEKRLKK